MVVGQDRFSEGAALRVRGAQKTPKLTPRSMRFNATVGDRARSSTQSFLMFFNDLRSIAMLREEATGAQKRHRTLTIFLRNFIHLGNSGCPRSPQKARKFHLMHWFDAFLGTRECIFAPGKPVKTDVR